MLRSLPTAGSCSAPWVFDDDVAFARAKARNYAAPHLGFRNYANNLLKHGFNHQDIDAGGSDRLIDTIIPHGARERDRRSRASAPGRRRRPRLPADSGAHGNTALGVDGPRLRTRSQGLIHDATNETLRSGSAYSRHGLLKIRLHPRAFHELDFGGARLKDSAR